MNVDEIIHSWQNYLQTIKDWQLLVKGITPHKGGCGMIYEVPNPIERPNESFAVADMRELPFAEPHYHIEAEIYFVLQGSGVLVIGNKAQEIQKGSVIYIPSNTAHYTIPNENLVIAAVNTPPFQLNHYIALHETDKKVQFDKKIFDTYIK